LVFAQNGDEISVSLLLYHCTLCAGRVTNDHRRAVTARHGADRRRRRALARTKFRASMIARNALSDQNLACADLH
jgi:hypothetical protein